jgi:hypothetical protein
MVIAMMSSSSQNSASYFAISGQTVRPFSGGGGLENVAVARKSPDFTFRFRFSDSHSRKKPLRRARHAGAEAALDGGIAHIRDGNLHDNSGNPEAALEDYGNADDY